MKCRHCHKEIIRLYNTWVHTGGHWRFCVNALELRNAKHTHPHLITKDDFGYACAAPDESYTVEQILRNYETNP